MIVVPGTGVYISALVFGGLPRFAIRRAMAEPTTIAVSLQIKEELTEVLTRKFEWSPGRIANSRAQLWRWALARQ